MSKSASGHFRGTKGDIVAAILTLPPRSNKVFREKWENITDFGTKYRGNYRNKENGLIISFDPGQKGETGFRGKDHYHIHNPNADNKMNAYLDKDGNPVARGSKASHIIPEED